MVCIETLNSSVNKYIPSSHTSSQASVSAHSHCPYQPTLSTSSATQTTRMSSLFWRFYEYFTAQPVQPRAPTPVEQAKYEFLPTQRGKLLSNKYVVHFKLGGGMYSETWLVSTATKSYGSDHQLKVKALTITVEDRRSDCFTPRRYSLWMPRKTITKESCSSSKLWRSCARL